MLDLEELKLLAEKATPGPWLTDRDFEVLGELAAAVDSHLRVLGELWVRPLDCGGSNGSDHSYRLNKLARMGLAEAKPRGGWVRGSKQYTITDAGRAAMKEKANDWQA